MQDMQSNPGAIEKPTPNVKKGLGALALAFLGIGSALAVRAVTNAAVSRNLYGPTVGAGIQGVLALGGGFALGAYRQDRTAAAVAAANGAFAAADLWDQAALSMSQGATPTPTVSSSASASPTASSSASPSPSVSGAGRLPNQRAQAQQSWRQNAAAGAKQRVQPGMR